MSFDVPRGSFTIFCASGSEDDDAAMLAGLERLDGGTIRMDWRVVASSSPPVSGGERGGSASSSRALRCAPHDGYDEVAYPLKVRRERTGMRERVHNALAAGGVGRARGALSVRAERWSSSSGSHWPERWCTTRPAASGRAAERMDAELRIMRRAASEPAHVAFGITMIYVTHDQSEALTLSDQVILMSKGRIVEPGAPRQIYDERPASRRPVRRWVDLLSGSISGRNGAIRSGSPSTGSRASGRPFRGRGGARDRRAGRDCHQTRRCPDR